MDEGTRIEVYVVGARVRRVSGLVAGREPGGLRVVLDDGTVEPGATVVLEGCPGELSVHGSVQRVEAREIIVRVEGTHSPDRREFARAHGELDLRYQVVPEGLEVVGPCWLRQGEGLDAPWHRPPRRMDFSGSGVRFEQRGEPLLAADDELLVGFYAPGDDQEEHRLTARVVRRLDGDQVAVHFLDGTPGAIAALVALADDQSVDSR